MADKTEKIYSWKITKAVDGKEIDIANGGLCSLDFMFMSIVKRLIKEMQSPE